MSENEKKISNEVEVLVISPLMLDSLIEYFGEIESKKGAYFYVNLKIIKPTKFKADTSADAS